MDDDKESYKELCDIIDKDNRKLINLEVEAEKLLIYDLPIEEQKKCINKARKYYEDRKEYECYRYLFDDKTFWHGYISDLDFLNKIKLKDFRNALLYVIKDLKTSYQENMITIEKIRGIVSNIGRLDLALDGFKKRRPCTYSMQ